MTLSRSAELPRIGLTTYRESAAWGVWNESADLLPASYADAVAVAGGVPVLLPPAMSRTDGTDPAVVAGTALSGVHGLVLSGGADVDPARYGALRHERTGEARPDRDSWELTLARIALERQLPLLAICRGMQVLNVALGGTLVQHLPDVVGHSGHCPVLGQHGRHAVALSGSGRVGRLLGEHAEVATYHHQGLDRLGAGLSSIGWSEDGVVEAVELGSAAWVVGVQWHPEVVDGAPLFRGFVAECAQFASEHGMSNAGMDR